METVQDIDVCRSKDALEDRDEDVFDTLIRFPVSDVKVKLSELLKEGIDPHRVHQSSLIAFCPDQFPAFPEFVSWCAENYSREEKVVLNSQKTRAICKIEPAEVIRALEIDLPKTLDPEVFSDVSIIENFHHASQSDREVFLSTCLRPEASLSELPYPLDINLFNENTQLVLTLLAVVLGLDSDLYITEFQLSLLYRISIVQSGIDESQIPRLNFEAFIAERMHDQMVNFSTHRHFRFQAFLMKMIMVSSQEELQFPEIVFATPLENNIFNFINYMLSTIFKMIFGKSLPRVLPEMQVSMQLNTEYATGDWFLSKDSTVIRLYGFKHKPYVLPAFLTLRIFALEFLRQKLIVEDNNFLVHRQATDIKYPFTLGPFTIKNKNAAVYIEKLLKDMNFETDAALEYDPLNIISKRRIEHRIKALNHQTVEGMADRANWLEYKEEIIPDKADIERSLEEAMAETESEINTALVGSKRPIQDIMIIDDEETEKGKRLKTDESQELTSISEETEATENKIPEVTVREYKIEETPVEDDVNRPKNFMDVFNEHSKNKQESAKQTSLLFPKVRNISNNEVSLFTSRNIKENSLKFSVVTKDKISEMSVDLSKINAPDKILLHRQAGEVIYSDYLGATLRANKLKNSVEKLNNQLRQERAENKSRQHQIKKLQMDLINKDGAAATKLLQEKEEMILTLRRKLKIPDAVLIQGAELTILEKEKEELANEVNDVTAKWLKLSDEKDYWEKERFLLEEQLATVKKQLAENSQQQVQAGPEEDKNDVDGILQAMSQISLKDNEIKLLKAEIQKLKEENEAKEKEIKTLQANNQELSSNNKGLAAHATGQAAMQGCKHMVWDQIIKEVEKLRPYLDYIRVKEKVAKDAFNSCQAVKESLNRKPKEIAQRAITFLNSLSEADLTAMSITNRISVITWARRILGKYSHIENIEAKAGEIKKEVIQFKKQFDKLVNKGFPSFWNEDNELIPQNDYKRLLFDIRMDHRKFQQIDHMLTGKILMEKMSGEFEILNMLISTCANLLPISYAGHIEMRVLVKEMTSYDLPTADQWNYVEKYGKTRYSVHT